MERFTKYIKLANGQKIPVAKDCFRVGISNFDELLFSGPSIKCSESKALIQTRPLVCLNNRYAVIKREEK